MSATDSATMCPHGITRWDCGRCTGIPDLYENFEPWEPSMATTTELAEMSADLQAIHDKFDELWELVARYQKHIKTLRDANDFANSRLRVVLGRTGDDDVAVREAREELIRALVDTQEVCNV